MTMTRKTLMLLCTFALLVSVSASAQLNRSAVSVSGLDTNPCTPASPCRTLAQALSQTNAGGELIVLSSGGYGQLTIDRSISIVAPPGIYAGITVTPFTDAVTINLPAPGKVVLRGLTIEGMGLGANAIAFTSGGGKLHVERCVIDGFVYRGILTYYDTIITDSTIRSGVPSSNSEALTVDNAGAAVTAVLVNDRFIDNNNNVVASTNATITAWNTVAVKSRNYGFGTASGSTLNLWRCAATESALGGIHGAGGTVRVSECVVTDNVKGLYSNYGNIMETWQDNRVRGNTTDIDTTSFSPGTLNAVPTN